MPDTTLPSSNQRLHAWTTPTLLVVLGVPVLWVFLVGPWTKLRLAPATHLAIGELVFWGIAIGLIVTALAGDGLAKLGFQRLTAKGVAIAVAAAVIITLLVPGLTALGQVFGMPPTSSTERLAELAQLSIASRVLLLLRAGITEELIYRAYPTEWWANRSGKATTGALVGLAVFCLLHLPNWGLTHTATVVLPLGAVFTLLYLWQRNIVINMIAHALVDAAPLIVLPLVTPGG